MPPERGNRGYLQMKDNNYGFSFHVFLVFNLLYHSTDSNIYMMITMTTVITTTIATMTAATATVTAATTATTTTTTIRV